MRIDEPGPDNQAGGIDSFRRAIGHFADLGDFPLADGQIGLISRTASAVNDRPIFDYYVVCHRRMPPSSKILVALRLN